VNFPLDIQLKRFTACVIICLCDKWLPQQKETNTMITEMEGTILKASKNNQIMNTINILGISEDL